MKQGNAIHVNVIHKCYHME